MGDIKSHEHHTNAQIYVCLLSGCQNTPAKESRYCSLHDKHATSFKDDMAGTPNQHQEEDSTLIVKILDYRSTRQDTFYEVMFLIHTIIILFTGCRLYWFLSYICMLKPITKVENSFNLKTNCTYIKHVDAKSFTYKSLQTTQ